MITLCCYSCGIRGKGHSTHRNVNAALSILRNIGEVQERWQLAGELVGADVKDMHQDLAVGKLQRLLVEDAALAEGGRQRSSERIVGDVHGAQRWEEVCGVGRHIAQGSAWQRAAAPAHQNYSILAGSSRKDHVPDYR